MFHETIPSFRINDPHHAPPNQWQLLIAVESSLPTHQAGSLVVTSLNLQTPKINIENCELEDDWTLFQVPVFSGEPAVHLPECTLKPTSWWFQPIWKILVKILVKIGIFPKVRGENKNICETHHLEKPSPACCKPVTSCSCAIAKSSKAKSMEFM